MAEHKTSCPECNRILNPMDVKCISCGWIKNTLEEEVPIIGLGEKDIKKLKDDAKYHNAIQESFKENELELKELEIQAVINQSRKNTNELTIIKAQLEKKQQSLTEYGSLIRKNADLISDKEKLTEDVNKLISQNERLDEVLKEAMKDAEKVLDELEDAKEKEEMLLALPKYVLPTVRDNILEIISHVIEEDFNKRRFLRSLNNSKKDIKKLIGSELKILFPKIKNQVARELLKRGDSKKFEIRLNQIRTRRYLFDGIAAIIFFCLIGKYFYQPPATTYEIFANSILAIMGFSILVFSERGYREERDTIEDEKEAEQRKALSKFGNIQLFEKHMEHSLKKSQSKLELLKKEAIPSEKVIEKAFELMNNMVSEGVGFFKKENKKENSK